MDDISLLAGSTWLLRDNLPAISNKRILSFHLVLAEVAHKNRRAKYKELRTEVP